MMTSHSLGTLLRMNNITEEYMEFLQGLGMNSSQVCRVSDEYLCGEEGFRRSEEIINLLKKYDLSPNSLFTTYNNGIIDPKNRAENLVSICRQMNWAKRYGIQYILCHVGELPENDEECCSGFVASLKQLAAFAAENQQYFLFETGSIPLESLLKIFTEVNHPHLGYNFDPANVMYYNLPDSPDKMLDELAPWIKAVHCKDGVRPAPGQQFGKETVLGEGETRFAELITKLLNSGFDGPFIIEREIPIGPEQRRDISNAVQLLKSLGV